MFTVLFIVGIVGFILLTAWLGRGEPNKHPAGDTAFSGGGVYSELGPLTDEEWQAHREAVEEMERRA